MVLKNLIRYLLLIFAILPSTAAVSADEPMTFFVDMSDDERFRILVEGSVPDVFAIGKITEGTTERFLAFVAHNKLEMAKVHFSSTGGSLFEGIKLGKAIRTLQFHTAVGAYNPNYIADVNKNVVCASACAYAFAGGLSRFLDGDSGKLGIHQFYSKDNQQISNAFVQQTSGLIVAYLDEMGVDAKAFTISTVAGRDGMIWLDPELATELRFANNGVGPPVAEIKLIDLRPYLRIQQDFHNVTTRVLFNCDANRLSVSFGIITDPETSGMIMSFPKRSYLELDHKEFLVLDAGNGAEAADSAVWITRDLTPQTLLQLANANRIDGWVDGSGAVRWGARLDVPDVRNEITNFAKQCFAR